jgi:hypothetical protein
VRNHWTKYKYPSKGQKTPRIWVLHDKSHTVVGYIDDISQTAGALCKLCGMWILRKKIKPQ